LPLHKNFGTRFSEVFLVQIRKIFEKHLFKVLIQGKKNQKTRSEIFIQGQKWNFPRRKEMGIGERETFLKH
jgi:hypothetical protein